MDKIIKIYVKTSQDGYIDSWADRELLNFEEVQAKETLIGLLGCVKVANGVAVLDEEKYKELAEQEKAPNELDQIKQELQSTKEDLTNTQLALAEVYEMIGGGA